MGVTRQYIQHTVHRYINAREHHIRARAAVTSFDALLPNLDTVAYTCNTLLPFSSLFDLHLHLLEINRKPVESDSDDDEVGAWDGTIAPGEQPPRKLSSLGLNKTLSDLFRQDHGDGKDGGESDGSAVTTKAHLDHLGNGVPSTSSMSTSTAFS